MHHITVHPYDLRAGRLFQKGNHIGFISVIMDYQRKFRSAEMLAPLPAVSPVNPACCPRGCGAFHFAHKGEHGKDVHIHLAAHGEDSQFLRQFVQFFLVLFCI